MLEAARCLRVNGERGIHVRNMLHAGCIYSGTEPIRRVIKIWSHIYGRRPDSTIKYGTGRFFLKEEKRW